MQCIQQCIQVQMRKRLKMPTLAGNKCFARRRFSLDARESDRACKGERRWTLLARGRNIKPTNDSNSEQEKQP
jgi:hypothetical protein